jgi:hypothetical protein
VVPSSRDGILLPLVLTVLLLAAAAAGARPAARRLGRRTTWALVALWVLGYGLAVLSWATPDAIGWLAAHVPGGGLLRDGARFLVLCAPLTVVLVAAGVERLADHWRDPAPRVVVAIAAALVPLAVMPDAAWGISGNLRPATYPADYAQARSVLTDPPAGDVLVLPFTSYRAPAWNHGRKVLDPLPRYLQPNYVVNDQLAVDGRLINGEDPRVPEVLAALGEPTPEARATALGEIGISVVARETDVATNATYDAPIAGSVLYRGADLELVALDTPVDAREVTTGWWIALGAAWAGFLGVLALGLWNGLQSGSSRMRTRPGSG